jgi:leader peptidase (prepilin peptidase) / N-methyltransferase
VSRLRPDNSQAAVSSPLASDGVLNHSGGARESRTRRGGSLATVTIAMTALAAVVASMVVAPGPRGLLGGALALLMLAIAVVDARRFIIPNPLTAATLGLPFVHAAIQEPHGVLTAIGAATMRGAVLALLFLGLRELYLRLRGREGLGLGDVKLAGAGGAWLDWSMMPIAVEIAALGALAYYGVRHVAGVQAIRARSRVPFGLFLAPAIWLAWLLEALLGID